MAEDAKQKMCVLVFYNHHFDPRDDGRYARKLS